MLRRVNYWSNHFKVSTQSELIAVLSYLQSCSLEMRMISECFSRFRHNTVSLSDERLWLLTANIIKFLGVIVKEPVKELNAVLFCRQGDPRNRFQCGKYSWEITTTAVNIKELFDVYEHSTNKTYRISYLIYQAVVSARFSSLTEKITALRLAFNMFSAFCDDDELIDLDITCRVAGKLTFKALMRDCGVVKFTTLGQPNSFEDGIQLVHSHFTRMFSDEI